MKARRKGVLLSGAGFVITSPRFPFTREPPETILRSYATALLIQCGEKTEARAIDKEKKRKPRVVFVTRKTISGIFHLLSKFPTAFMSEKIEVHGALKLREARQYLGGLSTPTMHRLIRRGLLRPNRSTRHLLFPVSELDRFLRDGMSNSRMG